MTMNLQVFVRSLPPAAVDEGTFGLREAPLPTLAPGQVLVRNRYLSLDPYMRKRLGDAVAGRADLAPGDTMMGRTVGEVVESRDPSLRAGDTVLGWGGWQLYSAEPATVLRKLPDMPGVALSAHLNELGRPGITAWLGVVHVANVRAGDCFVVSSSAGAVGSIAGQVAKHQGARVVGIAGGPGKCAAVTGELCFDACVDYKSGGFENALREATPSGADVCFENVGAAVLDATLDRMNDHGRIAVCGLIGQYQPGTAYPFRNIARVLDRALNVTGFRIDDHSALHETALADLRRWLEAGVFRRWETVSVGLQAAPAAFIAMLEGRGRGKTLVQLT